LGEFSGAELVRTIAPDMGLEWRRKPDELTEEFDQRFANSVLKARGLPTLSDIDMRGRKWLAPSRGLSSGPDSALRWRRGARVVIRRARAPIPYLRPQKSYQWPSLAFFTQSQA
jgi:hypothetical protein